MRYNIGIQKLLHILIWLDFEGDRLRSGLMVETVWVERFSKALALFLLGLVSRRFLAVPIAENYHTAFCLQASLALGRNESIEAIVLCGDL